MSDVNDLERDIEATRARLDHTIVRLQDRLSVSGVMDDVLGQARASDRLGGFYEEALEVIRRNPIPVALIAAGIGLLVARMAAGDSGRRALITPPRRARAYRRAEAPLAAEDVPVMTTGAARAYDPDLSPRHPTQDVLESRRELSARA